MPTELSSVSGRAGPRAWSRGSRRPDSRPRARARGLCTCFDHDHHGRGPRVDPGECVGRSANTWPDRWRRWVRAACGWSDDSGHIRADPRVIGSEARGPPPGISPLKKTRSTACPRHPKKQDQHRAPGLPEKNKINSAHGRVKKTRSTGRPRKTLSWQGFPTCRVWSTL